MTLPNHLEHANWVRKVRKKQKEGAILSQEEIRLLEGDEALSSATKVRMNKGAYVRVKCDVGMIEGTIVGKDEEGNYLIEYARGHYALVRPWFVSQEFKLRDTALIEQEQYIISAGLYKRVVSKDGVVMKFLDSRLEKKRIKGEEIIFPDDEYRSPGDDWGTRLQ